MTPTMSEELLFAFSEYVAGRMGLHFPKERLVDLERGLRRAAPEFGYDDPESCARRLLLSPMTKEQIETLASHLTVGETYFFRDRKIFEILENDLVPELIRKRRDAGKRIRMWSAGCATGEEPYSFAILLTRMIHNIEDWNITILATDINPAFLKKASEAVYGEWSFRDVPAWMKERYFTKTGETRHAVLPAIRKHVTFFYHNLAEDPYPSLTNNTNAMDIIVCRNVLMYFSRDRQKEVIGKLCHCLVDKGLLIVSPTEVSTTLCAPLFPLRFSGVTLYQKDSQKTAAPELTIQQAPSARAIVLPLPVAQPFREPIGGPDSAAPATLPGETALQEAAASAPQLPGYYQQALANYEQGWYEKAEEAIITGPADAAGFAPGLALLSRIRANMGKLADARELCEKAIAADKLNPGYQYLLATVLQEMGLAAESAACLKRALYLDQNFVLAHFALGNLSLRLGRTRESGRHFENARSALRNYRQDDILPESEGMTAGRLEEIIGRTTREVSLT